MVELRTSGPLPGSLEAADRGCDRTAHPRHFPNFSVALQRLPHSKHTQKIQMPGASALHFAAFGLGAVLGAGATAIITKRKDALPVAPPAHHPVPVQQPRPVIQIDERNRPQISNSSDIAMLGGNLPGVLKYGHPGSSWNELTRVHRQCALKRGSPALLLSRSHPRLPGTKGLRRFLR